MFQSTLKTCRARTHDLSESYTEATSGMTPLTSYVGTDARTRLSIDSLCYSSKTQGPFTRNDQSVSYNRNEKLF
jgi:hypothetical protein